MFTFCGGVEMETFLKQHFGEHFLVLYFKMDMVFYFGYSLNGAKSVCPMACQPLRGRDRGKKALDAAADTGSGGGS